MRYVNKNKRQFIAGAVCPACKAQDTIVQIISGDSEHIECVVCDHSEGRPTPEEAASMQTQQADNDVGIVTFKFDKTSGK